MFSLRDSKLIFTYTKDKSTRQLYIAFGITSGEQFLAFLFDTDAIFNAKNHFEEYLTGVRATRSGLKSLRNEKDPFSFEPPIFISSTQLGPSELSYINALENMFTQIRYPYNLGFSYLQKADPQLSVLVLVVLDSVFQISASKSPSGQLYSLNYFREVLETLKISPANLKMISPFTYNQLTGIREENQIHQKSFYNTFLTALISKKDDSAFRRLLGPLTKVLDKIVNENMEFDSNYITVDEFSETELDLVELIDEILIGLFSYEGYTMLSLGFLSFSFVKNNYIIKPLTFSNQLVYRQMKDFNLYSISSRGFLENIQRSEGIRYIGTIIPSILFGTKMRFNIRGSNEFRLVHRLSKGRFLSSISSNGYTAPVSFKESDYITFGKLSNQFMDNYLNLKYKSSNYYIVKNMKGKMAIGSLLGDIVRSKYSVPILNNWALNTLRDPQISQERMELAFSMLENTKIWSDLITSYAMDNVWYSIIKPGTALEKRDPTQTLRDILLNSPSVGPIKISVYVKSIIKEFFADNNEIIVPYEKVLSHADEIQWSLKYTQMAVGSGTKSRDLSYLSALNYLQEKIIYTYSALYEIISTNFNDGDILTAIFHKITPSGYHKDSTLSTVLKAYQKEFIELKGNRLRYTFDITSADGELKLRQFVGEIVYYLTTFGATFMLKEGVTRGKDYVLAGNLMQLLSESHIRTSAVTPLGFSMNAKGYNLLSTYRSSWNKGSRGNPVWTFGDLIPGHLVMHYTNEGLSVRSKFNNMLQLFGSYQIRGLLKFDQL
ncbi:hypothetical protein LCGC14_0965450 [marine sediment metagenome]|uniref:Uncharacterized protein n=1 Tax=marine sediment metagenome TaxID=412755 RepID=A0A0F9RJR7_9ZZZZ